tara:strand:- start:835 stop:1161 length:327 start_codon:yes stop_codon:yes gene_type:complete
MNYQKRDVKPIYEVSIRDNPFVLRHYLSHDEIYLNGKLITDDEFTFLYRKSDKELNQLVNNSKSLKIMQENIGSLVKQLIMVRQKQLGFESINLFNNQFVAVASLYTK